MEDLRLTISTRATWCRYVPAAIDSEQATRQMVELGASEFLRFRGVLTVAVLVQSATASRSMTWRGTEEIAPI